MSEVELLSMSKSLLSMIKPFVKRDKRLAYVRRTKWIIDVVNNEELELIIGGFHGMGTYGLVSYDPIMLSFMDVYDEYNYEREEGEKWKKIANRFRSHPKVSLLADKVKQVMDEIYDKGLFSVSITMYNKRLVINITHTSGCSIRLFERRVKPKVYTIGERECVDTCFNLAFKLIHFLHLYVKFTLNVVEEILQLSRCKSCGALE